MHHECSINSCHSARKWCIFMLFFFSITTLLKKSPNIDENDRWHLSLIGRLNVIKLLGSIDVLNSIAFSMTTHAFLDYCLKHSSLLMIKEHLHGVRICRLCWHCKQTIFLSFLFVCAFCFCIISSLFIWFGRHPTITRHSTT